MAVAHSLGFPRIGRDRELKKAQEAFWKGELDEAGLRAVGRDLRSTHWALQQQAGIDLLPVGDFAWYDQVLTHSLMFGVVPERFRPADGQATLHTLFAMARGVSDSCCGGAHAQEMTKWFDTNYHYLVPEFSVDQQFHLAWDQLFEEVQEALDLGHSVKPVVIGPLTYLWLGKAKGADFDKLDLLERLLPLYGQIFQRLAELGVEWVQIDEPILALDLPQDWKNAFERAYNLIQRDPLKIGGHLLRRPGRKPWPGCQPSGGWPAYRPGACAGPVPDHSRPPASVQGAVPGRGQRPKRVALRPGKSPGHLAACP